MKILQLNQFGTCIGGVETYIRDVSLALRQSGHSTLLVSFAAEDPGEPQITERVRVSQNPDQTVIERLQAVIDEFSPDVVYVHGVYDPRIVEWTSRHLPTLAYVHSAYLVCPGYAYYMRHLRRPCRRSAGVGCLVNAQLQSCCFGRNPLRHAMRLHDVRSFIRVYSGLNLLAGSRFMLDLLVANGVRGSSAEVLAPFLAQPPLQPLVSPVSSRAILFAGRLVEEKGFFELLLALARVESDWHLLVAGDGPDRPAGEALACRLGISDRITFCGWVGRAEMAELYRQANFAVVPSLWPEPFGRVGPEAAVHARASVAFDVGGVREWLSDGVTGFAVRAGDARMLAQRIEYLLARPDLSVEMGRIAQEQALRKWRAEDHVNKLVGCFSKAINRFNESGEASLLS